MKHYKPFFLILFLISYLGFSQIIKKQVPDKVVVLSFDDAPASQYSIVAPLLKKYDFKATFFVCEFPPNFSDSTLYMNWRQIKLLDEMGFEVANHTKDHLKISTIPKNQLIAQINYIEQKCDSLQIEKPISFAYPGYNLNENVLETLEETGYKFARAGGSRAYNPLIDHPFLIPSWATNATNMEEIMDVFKEAKDGKIVVLTIHGVPDIEHPWVNTSPELFKEYFHYLSENNFKVIALKDLYNYIDVEEARKTIVPNFSLKLKN